MSERAKIPDAQTRARSVARLRELVKRMDKHIADLDELNARLEEEFQNSPYGIYLRKRAERYNLDSSSISSK